MVEVIIYYRDGLVKQYHFETKEEAYWFIYTSGDAVLEYDINYVAKD